MMHGREKSDSGIVAGKPTNKAVSTAAEPVERRAEAKGNASQHSTRRTQSRVSVSQVLERIRQAVTKTLCRHTPKVGAVCPNWARTDLCGGRSVMSVPTAIRRIRPLGTDVPFATGNQNDSIIALKDGKMINFVVPYPMGFYANTNPHNW